MPVNKKMNNKREKISVDRHTNYARLFLANYVNFLKNNPNHRVSQLFYSDAIKKLINVILYESKESLVTYVRDVFTFQYKFQNFCGCSEEYFDKEFNDLVENAITTEEIPQKCQFLTKYVSLLIRCVNKTTVRNYVKDLQVSIYSLCWLLENIIETSSSSDIKNFLNDNFNTRQMNETINKREFFNLILNIFRYCVTRENTYILQEHFKDLSSFFNICIPLRNLKSQYRQLFPGEKQSLFEIFLLNKNNPTYVKSAIRLLKDLIEKEGIIIIDDNAIKNIILEEINLIINRENLFEYIASRKVIYKMIISHYFPYDEDTRDLIDYEKILREYYINESKDHQNLRADINRIIDNKKKVENFLIESILIETNQARILDYIRLYYNFDEYKVDAASV